MGNCCSADGSSSSSGGDDKLGKSQKRYNGDLDTDSEDREREKRRLAANGSRRGSVALGSNHSRSTSPGHTKRNNDDARSSHSARSGDGNRTPNLNGAPGALAMSGSGVVADRFVLGGVGGVPPSPNNADRSGGGGSVSISRSPGRPSNNNNGLALLGDIVNCPPTSMAEVISGVSPTSPSLSNALGAGFIAQSPTNAGGGGGGLTTSPGGGGGTTTTSPGGGVIMPERLRLVVRDVKTLPKEQNRTSMWIIKHDPEILAPQMLKSRHSSFSSRAGQSRGGGGGDAGGGSMMLVAGNRSPASRSLNVGGSSPTSERPVGLAFALSGGGGTTGGGVGQRGGEANLSFASAGRSQTDGAVPWLSQSGASQSDELDPYSVLFDIAMVEMKNINAAHESMEMGMLKNAPEYF